MQKASFISEQVESGEYYFLNLSPPEDAFGAVVCGGREACARGYRIDRRSFPYWGLEYVVSGAGRLTTGGRDFPIHTGAMYVYSPSTPHVIASENGAGLDKHFIDFVGPRFTRLLAGHPLSSGAPRYFPSHANLVNLFGEMLRNGRAGLPNTPAVCACLLEFILLKTANDALDDADAESPSHLRFQAVRALIAENAPSLRSLREIAALAHTDASYICRLFRRYGRESPCGMLLRMKMRRAADLFSGSPLLIKEVSEAVGIPDPYHFSRLFKRFYGCPPRDFIARIGAATGRPLRDGAPPPP